ncbi:MAG: protein translocase subunit SecF [Ruminococcus sp.]
MASNIVKKTYEEKLLVRGKPPIDFINKSKIFFCISIAIILIGIICNCIFGTTLDIQFSGGSMLKYSYTGEVNVADIEAIVADNVKDANITVSTSTGIVDNENVNMVNIQFTGAEADSTVFDGITKDIQKAYKDNNFVSLQESSVDASMGLNFFLKCLCAVAIASILMVLYVTLRFKKIGGLSAGTFGVVALLHDVAIIYFFYVIFRLPIDSSFIAVALMILGYSLNDTVVVYDRIREERKNLGAKAKVEDVFNLATTKVIRRTIVTSITTISAVVIVYVVASIYGLDSVKAFALPMIIGLVSGCYSSICIAGPLWVMWQNRKSKKEQ